MNKQSIIDEAVTQQDRLDSVIRWFTMLDESLPGEWGYSVTVNVTIFCGVKDMEDWQTVRGWLGNRVTRHRDKPSTVQQKGYAEKVWCFDSVARSREDEKFPAWEFILSLNPMMTGSSCKMVETGEKVVKVWEVECNE